MTSHLRIETINEKVDEEDSDVEPYYEQEKLRDRSKQKNIIIK